jgi:hypothetical protein
MRNSYNGGAQLVAQDYIAVGQNTLYFQKFNVVTSSPYTHQYMQNIEAPQNEGKIMKSEYNSCAILESPFVFIVPLYTNMPSTGCQVKDNSVSGESVIINSEANLRLRDSPNGSIIGYIDNGTIIIRLENATEKIGGYYWDRVSTPIGIGYMARASLDDSKNIWYHNKNYHKKERKIEMKKCFLKIFIMIIYLY